MSRYQLLLGDCIESLKSLPEKSIHTCVTSPPYYGLRDYGVDGQIGLEETPDEYIQKMVEVFREVRRVMRDDGTLWVNIGDTYGKGMQLLGVPWRLAFALQADGWVLRQDIIWHKPNAMPDGSRNRCNRAHEYVFLLSKTKHYFFDADAIKEPSLRAGKKPGGNRSVDQSRNDANRDMQKPVAPMKSKRSVWSVAPSAFKAAHFATFPPDLIEPCILAGCPARGVVLDPFGGSGTTAGVAIVHGRDAVLCELNPDYAALVPARIESIETMYAKRRKQDEQDQKVRGFLTSVANRRGAA